MAPSLACDYELVATDTHCHHHTVTPSLFHAPVLHPQAGAYRSEYAVRLPEPVRDVVTGVAALELMGHAVVFHHVGHHIVRVAVPAHHGLPVILL